MKKLNKVIAVLCSATMILGSTVTAFATSPDTAAGDGNILVFSVETVTLPTSVKIAFNPNGYTVTKKDGVTTTDQIVSLNYGIASTANKDRKITVSFEATGVTADGHTGTEEVVFVDAIEKAQAKTVENASGADYGEYKMYLAATASIAAPTKDGTNAFAPADFASDAISGTKTALADVSFGTGDSTTKGDVAFADGEAVLAYKLSKATYTQKDGTAGTIGFGTTQEQMQDKFDLTALGATGVVGFTFTGAMNNTADWTKAKITALKIQPEYEIEDIDGTEKTLGANGGLGQIEVAASATEVTATFDATMNPKTYKISLPVAASAPSDITNLKVNGVAVTEFDLNSAKDILRVTKPTVRDTLAGDFSTTEELTFTFTYNGTNYVAKVANDK